MNQNEQAALLCGLVIVAWLTIIVAILLAFQIRKKRNEKAKEYVLSTSVRYQDILKQNQKFPFYELQEEYHLYKIVNSKAQLDRFNFDAFLEDKISDDPSMFNEIIRRAKANRNLLVDYQSKMDNEIAGLLEKNQIDNKRISYKKYREIEEKLIDDIVQKPVIEPYIACYAEYSSPKGRNSYQDRKLYNLEELSVHILNAKKKREQKETKSYQRRIMTDSLRYDIMKRDGFHCVLCGRGAEDGVKLHVDHIIPVSKGGKTTPDNLRTLCERCNLGKRDKYDDSGIN